MYLYRQFLRTFKFVQLWNNLIDINFDLLAFSKKLEGHLISLCTPMVTRKCQISSVFVGHILSMYEKAPNYLEVSRKSSLVLIFFSTYQTNEGEELMTTKSVDRRKGQKRDRKKDRHTERKSDWHKHKHTDGRTDRQKERVTDRQDRWNILLNFAGVSM